MLPCGNSNCTTTGLTATLHSGVRPCYGHVPSPTGCLQEVRRVPPANVLHVGSSDYVRVPVSPGHSTLSERNHRPAVPWKDCDGSAGRECRLPGSRPWLFHGPNY